MRQLNLKRPIIFFDLETTGVDHVQDRIVELAMVKMNVDGSRDVYKKRVNPGRPIPAGAAAIHGICDDDVRDAPLFKEIAHHLYQWMQHCDLGGYNSARFDLPVLVEEFMRAGINADFEAAHMVDAQHIFYRMEQRTLSAAYRFYCGKSLENAHSAEADILATIEVLHAQLERYEEQLSCEVPELCKYLSNGEQTVDYARRMVLKDGIPVFNFGKYKERGVEDVFTENPGYYDWMMGAEFSLHTKQKISEILNSMKLRKLQKKKAAKA